MSKLDELMMLHMAAARSHCLLVEYRGDPDDYALSLAKNAKDAYTAIQDALKAVVEDAERYRWAHDHATASTEYHAKLKGHGYETVTCWHVRTVHGASDTDLGAAIDAARKP